MGAAATNCGDQFSCFRKHENADAVRTDALNLGLGRDLNEAVLASLNKGLDQNAGIVQMISLSFAGANFPNLDTFTRTDGMCVLYRKDGHMWRKVGRTEVIMDNLSPEWVTSFDVQYQFEKREAYRVDVYDVEDYERPDNLPAHDKVGSLEFSLHEVVTARGATLVKDLEYDHRAEGASGRIKITADEHAGNSSEALAYKISGSFSQNAGMMFFLVYKFISPQVYKPVYKSEITASKNGVFSW